MLGLRRASSQPMSVLPGGRYQALDPTADVGGMNSRSPSSSSTAFEEPSLADDRTVRFLVRLLEDLRQGPLNLPCFPDIVPRVRHALDDPNSSTNDIVRIVGAEPRLAARLVQTAGSVVFNPSGRPAPNLQFAVTRLGRDLVQSVTTAFMIQQIKADARLRTVAQPLADLWEVSMRVALTGRALARLIKVPTEKIFLAGLMHAIGQFYVVIRSCEPDSSVDYPALRKDLLTEWQPMLSRAVLGKWGFDEIVCDTVARQHDVTREPGRAADIVDLLVAAVVLTDAVLHLDADLECTKTVTAFSRLKLDTVRLRGVLIHVENSMQNLRVTLAD